MINPFPFLLGPLEGPVQGNGQTGGVGLGQPKTPGNPSDNPFAKILRDQSGVFSFLKNIPLTSLSEDQRRLPDLESLLGNPDLSSQVLAGKDLPVDFLRESSSNSVELPLSVDVQPNPDLVTFLESDGQSATEREDFIPTSSISLTALGGNEVDEAEILQEQMGPSSGYVSHAGQPSSAVFSPQVFLAGGPGANGVQTKATLNKPGLPFLTGYSSMQTSPPVEKSLVDNSITQRIMNSDLQQFFQDAVKDNTHLVKYSDGESATESAVEPGKHVGKPLDRLSSLVQEADRHILRIPSPPVGVPQGPLRPLVNQAFQASLPFEETPTNLADVVQSTQSRMKYVNGDSSFLSGGAVNGKESSLGIQSELLRDSGLSSSDHRTKDVFDATGKSVGVDPSGGQGINNGMGGSTHSQAGFQQHSSSLSTGSGVRMAEERVPDLPTPALQRIQMDVQLSEANRIQIDVGVQHRQVYAGLLMDQATLKNLAMQFVPQLEDQLAQSDMDLQEFSAEVRDHHREPESETRSHGSVMPHVHRGTTTTRDASESLPNSVMRVEALGLHLVA